MSQSFTVDVDVTYDRGHGDCGQVTVTWECPCSWSPYRRGDYYNPPEGGMEIDGDPRPVSVVYYPSSGGDFTVNNIELGSIADILISREYGPPCDGDILNEASEYLQSQIEAAKEAAIEAREERMRGY